jgi:hypothetical protein
MAICRLGSDAYRGGRSEPRRFGQSASWSTALTIWPFTVRVGHTDWPLAGVMRAGQHFPRHRRRQRNPSRIKAGWSCRPPHNGGGDSGPSEHAQNGFYADVTRSQPGIAEFSFPRRLRCWRHDRPRWPMTVNNLQVRLLCFCPDGVAVPWMS